MAREAVLGLARTLERNLVVLAGDTHDAWGNDPLEYADTARRGYLVLTAGATQCRGDWVSVDTITSRSFRSAVGRSMRVLPGASGQRLVAA